MEYVGLVIMATLFIYSGIANHILNADGMIAYTESVVGKNSFNVLAGWPTGVFLVLAGLGAAAGWVPALWALFAFLVVVTIVFHRNFLEDPAGFKGISLAGAILALAVLL